MSNSEEGYRFLDRIDSQILAIPLFYYLLEYIGMQ